MAITVSFTQRVPAFDEGGTTLAYVQVSGLASVNLYDLATQQDLREACRKFSPPRMPATTDNVDWTLNVDCDPARGDLDILVGVFAEEVTQKICHRGSDYFRIPGRPLPDTFPKWGSS